MENTHPSFQLLTLVQRHWFKIGLIVLLLLACYKKNVVFDVRLRESGQPVQLSGSSNAAENGAALSDLEIPPKELSVSSLKIPFFGSKKASGISAELSQISDSIKIQYLKRFAKVAVGEQKKYGIPASVILGSALIQSYGGKRDITLSGNNHFALSCTKDWKGLKGIHEGECYRVYENAWSSFRDNSLYLISGTAGDMNAIKGKGYKVWAAALGKNGYSDNAAFAATLTEVIEYYHLNQLDE